MARLDYLDVNDAKIEALWQEYLKSRGLATENDPIPISETPRSFRRAWEKYLYAQRPTGAAGGSSPAGGAGAGSGGGMITDAPTAARKIAAGELPSDVDESAALAQGVALLYEHKEFGGMVWALPPGRYAWFGEAGIANDQVSSVKVPPGYRLTMFEHKDFNGKSRVATGNISFIDGFNDMASSAKVEKA